MALQATVIDIVDHVHGNSTTIGSTTSCHDLRRQPTERPTSRRIHWRPFVRNRWEIRIKVKDGNGPPTIASKQAEMTRRSSCTTSQRSSSTTLAHFSTNRLSRMTISLYLQTTRKQRRESRRSCQTTRRSFRATRRPDSQGLRFTYVHDGGLERKGETEEVREGQEQRRRDSNRHLLDLWRLKLNGQDLAVNFEWLRPGSNAHSRKGSLGGRRQACIRSAGRRYLCRR